MSRPRYLTSGDVLATWPRYAEALKLVDHLEAGGTLTDRERLLIIELCERKRSVSSEVWTSAAALWAQHTPLNAPN